MLIQVTIASLAIAVSHAGAMLIEEHEQISSSPVQHEFSPLFMSLSSQPTSYASYPHETPPGFDDLNSGYYRHYDRLATAVVESGTTPTGQIRLSGGSGSLTSTSGGVSTFGSPEPIRLSSNHPTSYETVHATMAPQFQTSNEPAYYSQYPLRGAFLPAKDRNVENRFILRTPSSTVTSPTSNVVTSPYQDHNTLQVTGNLNTAPNVRYSPAEYAQTQTIPSAPAYFLGQGQQPTNQNLMYNNVDFNQLYPRAQAGLYERPLFNQPDQIVEIINGIPHITKFIRGPRSTTTRPTTLPVSPTPMLQYPSYSHPSSPLNGVPRTHPMPTTVKEPPAEFGSIPRTHFFPSPERPDILSKYSPTYPQPKGTFASTNPLASGNPRIMRYLTSPPSEGTIFVYPDNYNSYPSEDNGNGPVDSEPYMRSTYPPPTPRRIYIVRSQKFVRESYAPGEAEPPTPTPFSHQHVPYEQDVPIFFDNMAPAGTPRGFPSYPLERPRQLSSQPEIVYLPIDDIPVKRYPRTQYSPFPYYTAPELLPRVFKHPIFSNNPDDEPRMFLSQTAHETPINYQPSSPIRTPTPMPPASDGNSENPRQPYPSPGQFFDGPTSDSPYKTVPQQQHSISPFIPSQQYPSYPPHLENIVPSQENEPWPHRTFPRIPLQPLNEGPEEIYYVDTPETPNPLFNPSSGQPLQQLPQQGAPIRDPHQPNVEYLTDNGGPEPPFNFQDPPIPRTVKVIRRVVIRRTVTNTSHPDIQYIYPEELLLPQYPSQLSSLHPEQSPHYPDKFLPSAQLRNPYPSTNLLLPGANTNSPYDTFPQQQHRTSPIPPFQQYPSYPSQPENGIPSQQPEHVRPHEDAPQNQYPASPEQLPTLYPPFSSKPPNYYPRYQPNQPSIANEIFPQDNYPTSPYQSPPQHPLQPSTSTDYNPNERTEPAMINSIPRQQHPSKPDHPTQTQRPSHLYPSFFIPSDGRNEQLLPNENPFGKQYPTYPSQQPQYPFYPSPALHNNPTDRTERTIPSETAPHHRYLTNPPNYPSQLQQPYYQPTDIHFVPNDRTKSTMPFETAPNQQYPAKPTYPFEHQRLSPFIHYNPSDRNIPLTPNESAPKQQYPDKSTYSRSQPQPPSYSSLPSVPDIPSDRTEPFTPSEHIPRQRQYPAIPTQHQSHPPYPSPSINHISHTPEHDQPLLQGAPYIPSRPGQGPLEVNEYIQPRGGPVPQYPSNQPSSHLPSPTRSPFAMSPEYNSIPKLPEQQPQDHPMFDWKRPVVAQEPVFDSEERNFNSNPVQRQPGIRQPYSQMPLDVWIPREGSNYPTHQLPNHPRNSVQKFPIRTVYEEQENEEEEILTEQKPRPHYPQPLKQQPSHEERPSYLPSELGSAPMRVEPIKQEQPYYDEIPVRDNSWDQYPANSMQHPSRPSSTQLHDWPESVEPASQPRRQFPVRSSKTPQQKVTPQIIRTYWEEEENEEESILTRPKPQNLQSPSVVGPRDETKIHPQSPDVHRPLGNTLQQQDTGQQDHSIRIPAEDSRYHETDRVPQNHYVSSPTQYLPQTKQSIRHYPSHMDTPTELHHPTPALPAPLDPYTLRRVPPRLPTGDQPYTEYPDEYISNSPLGNVPQRSQTAYGPKHPKHPSRTDTYYEEEENEEEQILMEPLYPPEHPSSPQHHWHPDKRNLLPSTETITTTEESEPGRYVTDGLPRLPVLRRIPHQPGELPFNSPRHRNEVPAGDAPSDAHSSGPLRHPSPLMHTQYPSDRHSVPQQSEPLNFPSEPLQHSEPGNPDQQSPKNRPYHASPTIDDGETPTKRAPQKYVLQHLPSLPKPQSTNSYYEEEENIEEIMEEHPPLIQNPVHSIQTQPTSQAYPEDGPYPQGSDQQQAPTDVHKRQHPRGRQPNFFPPTSVATNPEHFEPGLRQPLLPTSHITPIKDQPITEDLLHYKTPNRFQLIEPTEHIPHNPYSINHSHPHNNPEVSYDNDYNDLLASPRRPQTYYPAEESQEEHGLNNLPIHGRVTKTSTTYKNAVYDDIPSEEYPDESINQEVTRPTPSPQYPSKQHQYLHPKPIRASPHEDEDYSTIQRVLNSLPPNFDLSKICPYLEKMRNNKPPTASGFESGGRRPISNPTNGPTATHKQHSPTATHNQPTISPSNQPITRSEDDLPITALDSNAFVEVIAESLPSSELYRPTTATTTTANEVKDLREVTTVVDGTSFDEEANKLPQQLHIEVITPPPTNPHESPIPASIVPVTASEQPQLLTSNSFTEEELEVQEENDTPAMTSPTTVPASPPSSNALEDVTKSVSSGVHDTISQNSADSLQEAVNEDEPTGSMSRKVVRSRVIEHIESNFTPGGVTQEKIVMPNPLAAQGPTISKRLVMEGASSAEAAMAVEAVEESIFRKTMETPHSSASMKMVASSMSGGATVSNGMSTGGGGKMVRYVTVASSPSLQSGAIMSRSSGAAQQPTPPRYKLVTIPGSIQTFTPAFPPGTKMIASSIGSATAPGYKTVRVPVKMVNG